MQRLVELLNQLSIDEAREELGPPLPERYSRAMREVLADGRQTVLVLETDGRIVATATVVIVPNLSYGARPYAIVENVVVDAGERSKGWGEALMRRAGEIVRDAGCHKAALSCNEARTEARRFYEKIGFKPTHVGYRIDF